MLVAPIAGREAAPPTDEQIALEGADFMATMIAHQSRTD